MRIFRFTISSVTRYDIHHVMGWVCTHMVFQIFSSWSVSNGLLSVPKMNLCVGEKMVFYNKHFAASIKFNKEYQLMYVNRKMKVVGSSCYFQILPVEISNMELKRMEQNKIMKRLDEFLEVHAKCVCPKQCPEHL